MSFIGQFQSVSDKIIKTEGDYSDSPLPESDKDDDILITEENRVKPIKKLRFSSYNSVLIFDKRRHPIYRPISPLRLTIPILKK